MLEKLKQNIAKTKEEMLRARIEKETARMKELEQTARAEQKRMEKEQADIEAEKQRLLNLSTEEIMVELIFAMRGFYARSVELEHSLEAISEEIADIEDRLSDLERSVSDIERQTNNNI